MDTRTGHIYERNEEHENWVVDQMTKLRDSEDALADELSDEEMLEHITSGRMVTGTKKELLERRKRMQLANGTKNQRKKYRQMQKSSRKKNRRK